MGKIGGGQASSTTPYKQASASSNHRHRLHKLVHMGLATRHVHP